MTEAQWLACRDPELMQEFLRQTRKVGERKFRLFGCACCRRLEDLMFDERNCQAIEATERFADCTVLTRELPAFHKGAIEGADTARRKHARAGDAYGISHVLSYSRPAGTTGAAWLVALATHEISRNRAGWFTALRASSMAADAAGWRVVGAAPWLEVEEPMSNSSWNATRRAARTREETAQAELLRHIVGNPFRPPHAVAVPATVIDLANAVYDGRDCAFALHDALLEAGEGDLAAHFRQDVPHPKGCWVVDLVLGKE